MIRLIRSLFPTKPFAHAAADAQRARRSPAADRSAMLEVDW